MSSNMNDMTVDNYICAVCGAVIPIHHVQLGYFDANGHMQCVCITHEGSPELEKFIEEMHNEGGGRK